MTKKVLLATNNADKLAEIRPMLAAAQMELVTLADLGLQLAPEETGTTFEENANIKARETAALLEQHGHSLIVLADDSGLVIDALGGAPGVDSALYLGADTPYSVRFEHILQEMKNTPQHERTARFVCVIACHTPGRMGGEILTTRGEFEGQIVHEVSGMGGMGYDPIFLVPKLGKTAAELSQEEKNAISHRGTALREMMQLLRA